MSSNDDGLAASRRFCIASLNPRSTPLSRLRRSSSVAIVVRCECRSEVEQCEGSLDIDSSLGILERVAARFFRIASFTARLTSLSKIRRSSSVSMMIFVEFGEVGA